MARYLVATMDTAATTAACDYLANKLEEGDEVFFLLVEGAPDRLARIAHEELPEDAVRAVHDREKRPDRAIVTFAREANVEEIVVGAGESGKLATVTRSVLEKANVPVFVVSA